ncbi:mandelate racemase/muconate lactonizing enzyme family protein [Rhizobium jaguaris]|uniref:Mandelate racemase/muconate lactonizing enzyme family protein n=1 Tax=Rhizobium jaguaris TaxID=1312183 RepID=A0A387FV21_9HYPH|nr:mandelate racemase/muconate lactonizing enzyme family protein [Rhizobium jaguaris]AYG63000.1 mandelate racemase/muconate lactonizing enzyme family protein [Rhizobium jaguaris]
MKIKSVEAFQLPMGAGEATSPRCAFVRIETEDGRFGLGEASPMQGGVASLGIIARDMAPYLVGKDVLDHTILLDTLFHKCVKLGPEGATTAALAALDIALWDLKGKLLGQPVHKLLGGAWTTSLPCYTSIGNNSGRTVDEVLRVVERRVAKEKPAAVKIRWDGDRTKQDVDLAGDIAKAKAVRKLLGDDFVIGFDANNGYSIGGAIRVGRALEDLGYMWFEEPVQHYNVRAMGEVAQRLDITVSAGEQTYTLQGLRELIDAGVRMVQPDIVKMGGITGLMKCSALAHAHGVELVPHQTQPTVGHLANIHVLSTIMHLAKPVELADNWERGSPVFVNPSEPNNGRFELPTAPGLGVQFDAVELEKRKIVIKF